MKAWLAVVVIYVLGGAQIAHAVCSEPQPRLVCAEYSNSKLVLAATLLRSDAVLDKNDPEAVVGRYYTLRPDQVFRGTPGQSVRIYEGNDSGRASFDWKVGTRYLLFLFDSIEKKNEGVLALDGCGNSGPVTQATRALREIAGVADRGKKALIAGKVSARNLSGPLPNVQVLARSEGQIYKASTDRKGRFTIKVPPGHYTVEPAQTALSFRVFELSYEDPRQLMMQPGSCAQVQFVEVSRR